MNFLGGSAADIGILMEAFGRSLVLEPYVASVVLGGGLVAALGTPDQQATLLAPLVEANACSRWRSTVCWKSRAGLACGCELPAAIPDHSGGREKGKPISLR